MSSFEDEIKSRVGIDDDELMLSYYEELCDIISNLFPGYTPESVLRKAIVCCLSSDAVLEAIKNLRKAIDNDAVQEKRRRFRVVN